MRKDIPLRSRSSPWPRTPARNRREYERYEGRTRENRMALVHRDLLPPRIDRSVVGDGASASSSVEAVPEGMTRQDSFPLFEFLLLVSAGRIG
jgi:hypothetical protein